jgi:cysteine desulfurase / selenocysteine lyase
VTSARSTMTRRELTQVAAAAGIACALPAGIAGATRLAMQAGDDVQIWRRDFPALAQRINGRPLTYLDSAATTLRPRAVIAAISEFYASDNANPGATLHTLARRTHERYEAARSRLARFLNAAAPEEIVWVRGTTEGINLAAGAWARSQLRSGDEILLTVGEHASNMLPWRLVAAERGARVRFVDVDDVGRIRLDDLDHKLNERTRLLAFSHVSNVAGYVNPAAEICARARRAGARVLIDAAQSAPHVPLDVQALGCDFLAMSSHKVLGPMGIGVLWARRELLEEMPPYQAGAKMAHRVDFDSQVLEHAAHKFGAGTPNVAGSLGLAAAVDYLDALGRQAVMAHEARLTEHALARLREIRQLRLLGPMDPSQRIPVFAFVIPGREPAAILQQLDAQGIAIRAGDLAALPLLRRLGVATAARVSCHLYTTTGEIDRLADSLRHLVESRAVPA